MKYNSDKHNRHSIRLKNYDYSQAGAYFVSICVQNRECVFGNIVDGEMHLNKWGEIITEEWMHSTEIRKEIQLDEFVVMPNHIHGIVIIGESKVRATGRSPLPRDPRLNPSGHLSRDSNLPQQNASRKYVPILARPSGKGILMNVSSAMKKN